MSDLRAESVSRETDGLSPCAGHARAEFEAAYRVGWNAGWHAARRTLDKACMEAVRNRDGLNDES